MTDEWRVASLERELQRIRSDLDKVKGDLWNQKMRQLSIRFSDVVPIIAIGLSAWAFVIALAAK